MVLLGKPVCLSPTPATLSPRSATSSLNTTLLFFFLFGSWEILGDLVSSKRGFLFLSDGLQFQHFLTWDCLFLYWVLCTLLFVSVSFLKLFGVCVLGFGSIHLLLLCFCLHALPIEAKKISIYMFGGTWICWSCRFCLVIQPLFSLLVIAGRSQKRWLKFWSFDQVFPLPTKMGRELWFHFHFFLSISCSLWLVVFCLKYTCLCVVMWETLVFV